MVWIDALCINQRDIEERSQQVSNMLDIFRAAIRVVIWLGVEEDMTIHAFQLIQHITSTLKSHGFTTFSGSPDSVKLGKVVDELSREIRDSQVYQSALTWIREISWWSRVWVIQEVAFAKNALVMSGFRSLPFNQLCLFRHFLYQALIEPRIRLVASTEQLLKTSETTKSMMAVVDIHLACISNSRFDMFELFRRVHEGNFVKATDPRDYIFALLGLPTNTTQVSIQVDYSLSWGLVYQDATIKLIQHYGLDVLYCRQGEETLKPDELPSWTIDWRYQLPYPFGLTSLSPSIKSVFTAGGIIGPRVQICCPLHSSCLILRVVFADFISSIVRSRISTSRSGDRVDLATWVDGVTEMVMHISDKKNLGPKERQELCRKTVVTDSIFRGTYFKDTRRTTSRDDLVYQDLLEWLLPGSRQQSNHEKIERTTHDYRSTLSLIMTGRRPFATQGSRVGIGPSSCQVGDLICVVLGASYPFVLRKGEKGRYRFVGFAYVDSIMDGELVKDNVQTETIHVY